MSGISQNVVHAGPTFPRTRPGTVHILQVNNIPPSSYVENGQFIAQPAEREGQIRLVYTNPRTREGTLYVVADVNGTLTWVPAATRTTYLDATTGKEYDPLAVYYHTYYTNKS